MRQAESAIQPWPNKRNHCISSVHNCGETPEAKNAADVNDFEQFVRYSQFSYSQKKSCGKCTMLPFTLTGLRSFFSLHSCYLAKNRYHEMVACKSTTTISTLIILVVLTQPANRTSQASKQATDRTNTTQDSCEFVYKKTGK